MREVKTKIYVAPSVLKTVTVLQEHNFLQGSVVNNNSKVNTTGQELKEYNFEDTNSFNSVWE